MGCRGSYLLVGDLQKLITGGLLDVRHGTRPMQKAPGTVPRCAAHHFPLLKRCFGFLFPFHFFLGSPPFVLVFILTRVIPWNVPFLLPSFGRRLRGVLGSEKSTLSEGFPKVPRLERCRLSIQALIILLPRFFCDPSPP